MANPFVHIELTTDNPGKAKEFYGSLFSWGLEEHADAQRRVHDGESGDGPGGGMMESRAPTTHRMASLCRGRQRRATVAKAKKLGAKIMRDKTPIPQMVPFAILIDPTGGAMASGRRGKSNPSARRARRQRQPHTLRVEQMSS